MTGHVEGRISPGFWDRFEAARKAHPDVPSHAAVGRAVDVSGQAVSQWRTSEPKLEIRGPLAEFLGVPYRWLFYGEGNRESDRPDARESRKDTFSGIREEAEGVSEDPAEVALWFLELDPGAQATAARIISALRRRSRGEKPSTRPTDRETRKR